MSKSPAVHENPSAGTFDPPPAPSTSRESRARGWRGFAAMLALAVLAAQWLFPSARGWALSLLAAAAFTAAILEWVLLKNDLDEKGPFTEEKHITR
jgi:hypothetical protein